MLKMFHDASHAGGDAGFWEETWREGCFEEALRFCEVDPLRQLFERYVRPGDLLLEGGCGQGNYVVYQSRRGVNAVGLDFAQVTLHELRERLPSVPLAAGDVAALPLRSGSVDAYYSGGVVEHFEEGPDEALAEAARVLAPGGAFLCSVPYFNPLRRLLSARRVSLGEWQVVDGRTDAAHPVGRAFFQYAYRPGEFRRILANHGFEIQEQLPYSVLWGLYELPGLSRLVQRVLAKQSSSDAAHHPAAPPNGRLNSPRRLASRLAVSEDRTVPVLGLGVRLTAAAAANMMMYACKRLP